MLADMTYSPPKATGEGGYPLLLLDRDPGPYETILTWLRTGDTRKTTEYTTEKDLRDLKLLLREIQHCKLHMMRTAMTPQLTFSGSVPEPLRDRSSRENHVALASMLEGLYPLGCEATLIWSWRNAKTSPAFRKNCNGYSNTLLIVRSKSGDLFGAFTELAWHPSHVADDRVSPPCSHNSFLFVLHENGEDVDVKLVTGPRGYMSWQDNAYCMPIIGGLALGRVVTIQPRWHDDQDDESSDDEEDYGSRQPQHVSSEFDTTPVGFSPPRSIFNTQEGDFEIDSAEMYAVLPAPSDTQQPPGSQS